MARPYWSGLVQISLVQFGVSLYTATESKTGITFNQISRSTGERVRYQKTAGSEEGAATVAKDDIVKGYEYSKGQYVIVEPSELENLRVPSKHTIEVSQFIDTSELTPEYVESRTTLRRKTIYRRKPLRLSGRLSPGPARLRSGRLHSKVVRTSSLWSRLREAEE